MNDRRSRRRGLHTQITLTLEIAVAIAFVIFVAGILLGMVPLDDAPATLSDRPPVHPGLTSSPLPPPNRGASACFGHLGEVISGVANRGTTSVSLQHHSTARRTCIAGEMMMKRRTAVFAFSAGALPVFAPMVSAAYAQAPANMVPRDLGQYRTTTLMVGSLALQSSQLALQRVTVAKVKEFAGFETAEQLTMAQVLTDTPTPRLRRWTTGG